MIDGIEKTESWSGLWVVGLIEGVVSLLGHSALMIVLDEEEDMSTRRGCGKWADVCGMYTRPHRCEKNEIRPE